MSNVKDLSKLVDRSFILVDFTLYLIYNISNKKGGKSMELDKDTTVQRVFNLFQMNGYECYAVGGCVRDYSIGTIQCILKYLLTTYTS